MGLVFRFAWCVLNLLFGLLFEFGCFGAGTC